MGIVAAIKAIFGALGALFGFLKDRQLIDAGKAEQANANAQETLDTVSKVNAPIELDDIKRVRDKFRRD